jgi:hypothetical protein
MQPTVPDVEAVPRRSRHQDAEQIEARDALLRAAGVETRVLPLVTGTGKPVEIDPHARDCGPSPLSEEALAALRAYVGQNDAIDGTWDPMTCKLTKPERDPAEQPAPEPEPEDEEAAAKAAELAAARQKKAEKARKKRQRKKEAKRASQGKANGAGTLALNGKLSGSDHAAEREGWHSATLANPTPTTVRPEKPVSRDDTLRSLGFGRLERERVETFQRLQRLTGLVEQCPELNEGPHPMGPSIAQQLESFVVRAGQVKEIVDAREICAKLCNIADDLIAEVEHAIKYPEESHGRDRTVLEPLRARLKEVQEELAHRAGEPELMKTEAAERMRQKLEKRLLPKLKVLVPQMAEKLRFLHMEVLKWQAPARSAPLAQAEAAAAAAAEQQRAERQAQLLRQQEEQLAQEQGETTLKLHRGNCEAHGGGWSFPTFPHDPHESEAIFRAL